MLANLILRVTPASRGPVWNPSKAATRKRARLTPQGPLVAPGRVPEQRCIPPTHLKAKHCTQPLSNCRLHPVSSTDGLLRQDVRVAAEGMSFSFIAELPLAAAALGYAQRVHQGQRRDSDYAPFILHPLEVASMLRNTGHSEAVITAAILHDTIENTDTDRGDLTVRFGADVTAVVAALTEDARIEDFEKRKAALRAQIAAFGSDAIAVDAADKVAKVRELRAQVGREPDLLAENDANARSRLAHYVASLHMLEQAQADHPLVRQLRFELEALRALPPRPSEIAISQVDCEQT